MGLFCEKNKTGETLSADTAKLRVAILGSGNIGTDLLVKTLRSPYLTCSVFVGRNRKSPGMNQALHLGVPITDEGVNYLIAHSDTYDMVFDATSAEAHRVHAPYFKEMKKFAIDLTPSKIGRMCIPAVNLEECVDLTNVNMVTCGGQASIPIAYAIGQTHRNIEYIEVVSSIASKSAGAATRMNLDEYVHTTEAGVKEFSNAKSAKAILNLNPAVPCINMQTTVFAKVKNADLPALEKKLGGLLSQIQAYVPGYEIIVGPMIENDRIVVMVRVKGLGDYLPSYAGNLDIINCAAIAMAERYASTQIVHLANPVLIERKNEVYPH